ncbi:MAG: ParB/RepB/Spo0J family partition protein [Cyanobium sp. MAG06]|nr:ParB/RepB/Spo0J family partition protein [Cyanobium sp. MAG06]
MELDKIVPNPYQPRREFDITALQELSDSIKQYGVLQPLVVSRIENHNSDGSIEVIYELIAGERRLRASQIAGLNQVPCIIRIGDNNREKLELAIIENVVREDLNAVERALAYQRLADEFKLSWTDIGKKVSKSREYVSNTVRVLMLPQDILEALSKGKISEGHTRPLLMLIDKPDEQMTLFKEMLIRKMTVREAEKIARKIAFEKIRKKSTFITPDVIEMESNLAEALGTRVSIDPKEKGGKIQIDYFSYDELMGIVKILKNAGKDKIHQGMFDKIREEGLVPSSYTENILDNKLEISNADANINVSVENMAINSNSSDNLPSIETENNLPTEYNVNDNLPDNIVLDSDEDKLIDDRSTEEKSQSNNRTNDEQIDNNANDIYNIKNFSL